MQSEDKNGFELDLLEIFLSIWRKRKFVLKTTLVFLVVGIFISIFTRNEYKSETTILFESSNSSISGVTGLLKKYGGLAGVNINTDQENEGIIVPQLYPKIILSTPFLIDILNDTIEIDHQQTILYKYLDKHIATSLFSIIQQYTIRGLVQILMKNNDILDTLPQTPPFMLSRKQMKILNYFKERIRITMDEQTGLTLTVSVMMPDPLIAEKVTNKIITNLTNYLIEYKTEKAKQYLDFINKKVEEAKIRFTVAQNNLAKFRDKNKNVISLEFKTEEENLQSEYNLTFELYSTLTQQLEQAKLDVQKMKPIFKIISPANIPTIKEKPHRFLMIIGYTFLGLFLSLAYIFGKIILYKYKQLLSNKKSENPFSET